MQVEGRTAHAAELDETSFSQPSEAFGAVDMTRAVDELITLMMHLVMFLVTHVNDAVIGAEAVSADRRSVLDSAAQRSLGYRLSCSSG